MTLKSDAKFGEELTCCFKTDMRNLAILMKKLTDVQPVLTDV